IWGGSGFACAARASDAGAWGASGATAGGGERSVTEAFFCSPCKTALAAAPEAGFADGDKTASMGFFRVAAFSVRSTCTGGVDGTDCTLRCACGGKDEADGAAAAADTIAAGDVGSGSAEGGTAAWVAGGS